MPDSILWHVFLSVIRFISSFQTDLIGRSLFDFIHPSDHKEIKEILTRIIGRHAIKSFSFASNIQ